MFVLVVAFKEMFFRDVYNIFRHLDIIFTLLTTNAPYMPRMFCRLILTLRKMFVFCLSSRSFISYIYCLHQKKIQYSYKKKRFMISFDPKFIIISFIFKTLLENMTSSRIVYAPHMTRHYLKYNPLYCHLNLRFPTIVFSRQCL
jgi:hypothetical protein